MFHPTEPLSRPPIQRRGRLPVLEPTNRRAIGWTPPGSPSLEPAEGQATTKDVPQGYDPGLLGASLYRTFGSAGRHTRSKSCGFPEPNQPAKDSDGARPEPARSEEQDRRIPGTSSRRTRAHTCSPSRDMPDASSQWNGPAQFGGVFPWNLGNFPGVHDAALKPYSTCIGYTKKSLRCKRPSRWKLFASDAIRLAQGVPTIRSLEEIAGNLLCNRDHQYQNREIAERWLDQLTASPDSPESAASQDNSYFWRTPQSGVYNTITPLTTPSLSNPSPDVPLEYPASPAAARHARAIARRSGQPEAHGGHGNSVPPGGEYSESAGDDASRESSFSPGESWASGGLISFSSPSTSGRWAGGDLQDVPLLNLQNKDDVFAEGFKAPVRSPELSDPPSAGEEHTVPDPPSALRDAAYTVQTNPSSGITSPDLREILGLMSCTCIGLNRTKVGKCSRKIKEKTWEKSNNILETLAKHKLPVEAKAYFDGLEGLARIVLCWQHQRWARQEVDRWRSLIVASVGHPGLYSEASPSPAPSNHATPKVTTVRVRNKEKAWSGQGLRRSPRNVDTNFVYVDTQCPEIGRFEKYYTKKKEEKVSLRDTLAGRLTDQEISESGHIYVYWYPGNFGYLKIGKTKWAINARLKQWERLCGRKPLRIYPPENEEENMRTPHVYRVEALVRAELKQHRRRGDKCSKCGRRHKEWFEVPQGHAIAVVEKWRSWMAAETRYIKMEDHIQTPGGTRGPWLLKDMSESELSLLCQPPEVPTPSKPQKRTLRSRSILSSAPRRTSSAHSAARNPKGTSAPESPWGRVCECVVRDSDSSKRLRPKKCSGDCRAKSRYTSTDVSTESATILPATPPNEPTLTHTKPTEPPTPADETATTQTAQPTRPKREIKRKRSEER